jgi:thymidylate synthase (FAD)
MKVELVRYTENPHEAIEQAASNCYDSIPNGKIMKACYKSGHHSVLEFAQFHFHIEDVSRSLTHQLVRHRTASFAQRSQRYCSEDGFGVICPMSIVKNINAMKIFTKLRNDIQEAYTELQKLGIPNEDARYVLPNACCTTIDVSFDFRNLCHFMNERLCTRAQWEIRELANKMKDEVIKVFPEAKEMLVPKCERYEYAFCPESKSCGRHKTMKEIFAENKY